MSSSSCSPPRAPKPGHTGANTWCVAAIRVSVGSPARCPPRPWNATTARPSAGPSTTTSLVIPRAVVTDRTSVPNAPASRPVVAVIVRVCHPPSSAYGSGSMSDASTPAPKFVLFYEAVADIAERAPAHFDAHRAHIAEFAARGDLLLIGAW